MTTAIAFAPCGAFSEALADNSPLAAEIDRTLTMQMMQEIAIEHSKGRRLYLGNSTTR
ncbi:MAG: hypothetical protein K2X38_10325 [Gemmataceae bacterium]|nr:hypothetical protein [Gemmataceae bacterium]